MFRDASADISAQKNSFIPDDGFNQRIFKRLVVYLCRGISIHFPEKGLFEILSIAAQFPDDLLEGREVRGFWDGIKTRNLLHGLLLDFDVTVICAGSDEYLGDSFFDCFRFNREKYC